MKKYLKEHKVILIQSIIFTLILIFFIILLILKTNSDICEAWTKSFARFYETAFGTLFKWIPFSLTEVFFLVIIVLSVIFVIQLIRGLVKKNYSRSISRGISLLLIALSIFTAYQATAEMAYNRHPVPLELYESKVEKTEFRKIGEYFISDLNDVTSELTFDEDGEVKSPYSLKEMNNLLEKEFERIKTEFPGYFTDFTTRVKPMVTSFFYRELHITGVTFMPTTEANVNYLNVNALKPITYAHEIFHTKGVMREEEADLMALYLMLTSENPYFRYSGYYFSLSSLTYLSKYTGNDNDYKEVNAEINNNFKLNQKYGSDYWKKHNAFADFGDWINDLYLKMSGEAKGTDSYHDTPTDVDQKTKEITNFSIYQKLYFKLYYQANPVIE